jgi:hypothetical protein
MVFALGTCEYDTNDPKTTARQRAQHSVTAILYALDAATGKEIRNSGKAMTSFVHSGELSSGNSQVYVSTWDSAVCAFGIPMEREQIAPLKGRRAVRKPETRYANRARRAEARRQGESPGPTSP